MLQYFLYFLGISLFLGIMVVQAFAFKYAARKSEKVKRFSGGTVEAAIFALLGLLIALTFSGSQAHFEKRRQAIIDESNAISTAFLRLDLLSPTSRKPLQEKFLEYIDRRIFYSSIIEFDVAYKELALTQKIQGEIWEVAIDETRRSENSSARILLLPALNQMFDIVTSRIQAAQSHTQLLVLLMFIYVILVCSIFSGFRMAKEKNFSWPFALFFATAVTLTLFVILDLEYVRLGFIRLEFAEKALVHTKENMLLHMQG